MLRGRDVTRTSRGGVGEAVMDLMMFFFWIVLLFVGSDMLLVFFLVGLMFLV